MNNWRKTGEEASIVFVGHFNPKIFHPEWLIAKKIYKRWNYEDDSTLISHPDIARCNLPDNQQIEVLLSRFVMKAQRKSDFVVFRDKIVEIFMLLAETPIKQLGMNHTQFVTTNDSKVWQNFGCKFAKRELWTRIIPYYKGLEEKKQKELGLYSMTYQIPRPDDYIGHIRVSIEAHGPLAAQCLRVSVNNHIEITDSSNTAQIACNILSKAWEDSLEISETILSKVLQL